MATTRWVRYDVASEGVTYLGGTTASGLGTRGFFEARSCVGDSFDIGTSTNRLYVNIDGNTANPYITLTSGTAIDPRFVAKEITERLQALASSHPSYPGYGYAQCVWSNDDGTTTNGNRLIIYSGSLGSGSQVAVVSGTNTAQEVLGFGTTNSDGGSANGNAFNGGITVSGTYNGFFDEIYEIRISTGEDSGPSPNIDSVALSSGSYTGTVSAGGIFYYSSNVTYTITINSINGTTMNGGTGYVPTMTWTSTGSVDDSAGPVELLYADYWYNIGIYGLKVKFTDGVFTSPVFTIDCAENQYASGSSTTSPAETAEFIYTSNRGEQWSSVTTTKSGTNWAQLGTRGLYVKWDGTNYLQANDVFYVICKAPKPVAYDISSLDYGNVTVSTESAVKAVMFEIVSGATEISTVKFGLQSHGSFSNHDAGNDDTKIRFGTVGPGNKAGSAPINGKEWRTGVTAADLTTSETPPYTAPSYLHAINPDLAVVSDADSSEDVGTSNDMGMVADPVFLCIKLGASEVGANSSINYRVYFDYS